MDRNWILPAIAQHKRLKGLLPAAYGSISRHLRKKLDYSALSSFLFKMAQYRVYNLFFFRNLARLLFKFPQEKTSLDLLKYTVKTIAGK